MRFILPIGDRYSIGYGHCVWLDITLGRSVDKYRQYHDHHNASWKRRHIDRCARFAQRMDARQNAGGSVQPNEKPSLRAYFPKR